MQVQIVDLILIVEQVNFDKNVEVETANRAV